MGFIDYHGTRENRYDDVLDYTHAMQEEDRKKKQEQKLQVWLGKLTGNTSYARLSIQDLLKNLIIEYGNLHAVKKELDSVFSERMQKSGDQLWNDCSIDLARRHIDLFHLPLEKKEKYLRTILERVFRLSGCFLSEDIPSYYQLVEHNKKYSRYFAECFDPSWKGQQYYKWLNACVKKKNGGPVILEKFLDAYNRVTLVFCLYMNRAVSTEDGYWMKEIETERRAVSDIRGRVHRGTLGSPDYSILKNPAISKQEAAEITTDGESKETGERGADSSSDQDHVVEPSSEETRTSTNLLKDDSLKVPGFDRTAFQILAESGRMDDYISASRMLINCNLPEEIDDNYRKLIDRLPVLKDSAEKYDQIYHADLDMLYEYYIPEALNVTAVYLEYQAAAPSEKILKETRDSVHLAVRKLLQVVNGKIDEIYRFVTIDANAEAKALETIMMQEGYIDPEYRIR